MNGLQSDSERRRLDALASYDILDTVAEASFDDLAALAAYICEVPIALISLIDAKRQWFKSHIGLELRETSREIAFCAHAIAQEGLFVVEDAAKDERFRRNPLVTDDPSIRFYAGAPLITQEGYGLGTLCVLDRKPRELSAAQRNALQTLSRQVVSLMELRKTLQTQRENNELLDTARRLAVESSEFKSRFLANMSHEVRTPLNGIMGMAELLAETALDAEQERFVYVIQSSSKALLTIVNDILDLSKVEAGKLELESRPFDLREMLEKTIDLFSSMARAKNLELTALVHEGVPSSLCGDEGRIRQVLSNFLANALKFTSEGHVWVDVAADENGPQDALVRFCVADTGVGIAAAAQKRIFEPFTQADESTSRRFGGTGLGLSIAKQLAEAMGGSVGFESQEGKGSSFWFTARLRKEDAELLAPPPQSVTALNVLVVDPSERARSVLSQHLAQWKVPYDEAATGEEALARIIAGDRYHFVFVAQAIADMTPAELSAKIIRVAATEAPALYLTGGHGTVDVSAAKEAGYTGIFVTPVQKSLLFDALIGATDVPRRHENPSAPPSGKRVLLVDDNAANRFVATAQLRALGHEVSVAENGKQAVTQARDGSFDVILMDCQMPEMDGYEAAAEIRRGENGKRRVPIVAVTANALPSERQKVLAAGMDDYLAKPLQKADLERVLAKWINPDSAAHTDVRGALADLRSQVGADAVAELIGIFLADVPQMIEALDAAVKAREYVKLASEAHALRGSIANFRAADAMKLAQQLETAAVAENATLAAQLYARLCGEVATAREILEEERLHARRSPA